MASKVEHFAKLLKKMTAKKPQSKESKRLLFKDLATNKKEQDNKKS